MAAGAGLIPLPLIDFAAVTGVQLGMLALICDIYKQPFSKEAAMSIIASLAGGAIAGGEASSMALSSRLKFIPVVVLTSSREERDLVESYKLGVNAYVVKPVDFHEFMNAVEKLWINQKICRLQLWIPIPSCKRMPPSGCWRR